MVGWFHHTKADEVPEPDTDMAPGKVPVLLSVG